MLAPNPCSLFPVPCIREGERGGIRTFTRSCCSPLFSVLILLCAFASLRLCVFFFFHCPYRRR